MPWQIGRVYKTSAYNPTATKKPSRWMTTERLEVSLVKEKNDPYEPNRITPAPEVVGRSASPSDYEVEACRPYRSTGSIGVRRMSKRPVEQYLPVLHGICHLRSDAEDSVVYARNYYRR